ncbi:MAG: anthranilate synthase component I family protein [Chitinophagales bacterium]
MQQDIRISKSFSVAHKKAFKQQLLAWTKRFDTVFFLDSNDYEQDKYSAYECLVAVANYEEAKQEKRIFEPKNDIFEALYNFHLQKKDWLFGFFAYDLKNEIANLRSENIDEIAIPNCIFVQPNIVFTLQKNGVLEIACLKKEEQTTDAALIFEQIKNIQVAGFEEKKPENKKNVLEKRLSKKEYIAKVEALQEHINYGNIYEVNFCQEFYKENIDINVYQTFGQLNEKANAPFSAFMRLQHQYLLCGSPERFMKKSGQKVISQPIKGTIKRGKTAEEDTFLKKKLRKDPKECAENVMIVDLVRNDLTPFAEFGSVKVSELLGVYSFKTVHHLISTIAADVRQTATFADVLKAAFPMGSMTGAPKLRAMQLIEEFEVTKRGLYSGAVGYITPMADFDFNVVIRSLLYNEKKRYLSLQVGSAITHQAMASQEYEECLLKAEAVVAAISEDFSK